MSLSRDSRRERELKFLLRTQFRYRQGMERIAWEEEILLPEIEALKSGKSVLGLPPGAAFSIEIENVDQDQSPAADTTGTTEPSQG